MGIKAAIQGAVVGVILERPGAGKSYAQWIAALEQSGRQIDARAAAMQDAVAAGKVLRHISGIERWGQSRLCVFLGAPCVRDEYDGYRPGADLTLDQQRAAFRATREETVNLAGQIAQAGIADTVKVAHNQFGPLSARGWMRYLELHASLESKKLR